jgi:branched-chain amino acid transport system substrate-binding protein
MNSLRGEPMNRRTDRRLAILATAALLVLAGCGTRVSHSDVVAGAGGTTVSLDNASIQALKTAAGSAAAAAPAAATTTRTAANAPAAATSTTKTGTSTGGAPAPAPLVSGTAPPAGARAGKTGATAAAAKPGGGTAAAAPAAATAADAPCTASGAPLKLGQVGGFSGVEGPVTADARNGLATWVQYVNAHGGIACHPIVVYAVDDGADPARAAAAVQDLVSNKGVQALVGVFDPIGFPGILSGAEKAKIPVIGGDGIDFAWNQNPYLFPTGAGLLGAIRGALQQTVAAGKTNLGLLYCVEASVCTNGQKIIEDETKKAGAKLTYSSAISLTQPDFTAQCQSAKNAGVQAMGMAMDGASIGRVARSCAAISYHPEFITNGLVLSPQNANDPDIRRNTLASASAVAPWTLDDTEGQKEYHAGLAKFAPGLTPDADSIYAWAAGKLVEAAVHGLGAKARTAPITTGDLMTGLGTIHNETLGGLTPPMTFSPGQKAAPLITCVYFELLSDKGWTTSSGSKPQCTK